MNQASHSNEVPVYSRLDVSIESGMGVHIRDDRGREWIDFYGGHAVASLGYAHPDLLGALQCQAQSLMFQTNLVDVPVRGRAIEALTSLVPTELRNAFLVNSGAEANENALRMAFRARPGRHGVVCLKGGFHGRTAATGACTWGSDKGWYGFPRTPFDVTFVPPGNVQALEQVVDENTAAVILEPVLGIAGCLPLQAEYLQAVRSITRSKGALLIADEVQCGMGRTGHAFAILAAGVSPDLLTTAKGLAGGFPAGALLCTKELASSLAHGDMGTTFGGGPMACAMIEAVAGKIQEEGFLANVRDRELQIREMCQVGPVVGIQGAGLMLGLVCDQPAKAVLITLREKGIFAGGSADPMVVRLTPPLILGEEHVHALAQALASIPAVSNAQVS